MQTFGINSEIRENIFKKLNEKEYEKIANTRVFDLKKPFQKHKTLCKTVLERVLNINSRNYINN